MAIQKPTKPRKQNPNRSTILIATVSISAVAFLYILSSFNSTKNFSLYPVRHVGTSVIRYRHPQRSYNASEKYLYWGKRIDCPGKHCELCEGLGHQESSLRCALEEAMVLHRTFVMPSRMCINPLHNTKGVLHQQDKADLGEKWSASSCTVDSLYDLELISNTVPVILDNSEMFDEVLSTSMKLGIRGIAHVNGVSRSDLKEKSQYLNKFLLNSS